MIRAASWSCLLALACARVYERCELARDLGALGVERDHISTWVCIAYHESRFDTTSRNYYSGDHGIFQISELYWCGPGKACGLPCGDLRDEDISDDVQCALRVHEEHTRLQGNGFLAWVVYPQHCKHNTKKYIVGCDNQSKNASTRTASRSRTFSSVNSTASELNSNIDNLKPPYLLVNSLLRGNFGKVLQATDRNRAPVNWLNYKIDNIDDLTLPVFDQKSAKMSTQQRTTTVAGRVPTTTSATPTAAPWKRKYVESKQFRKRILPNNKESAVVSNRNEIVKSSPSYINGVTAAITSTRATAVIISTTRKPTTSTLPQKLHTTTYKPTTNWFTRTVATTSRPRSIITSKQTTVKPSTSVSTTKGSTFKFSLKPIVITTSRPNTAHTKVSNSAKTTSIPRTESATNPSVPLITIPRPSASTTLRPISVSTKAYSTIDRSIRDGKGLKLTAKVHPLTARTNSPAAATTNSRIASTQSTPPKPKTTLSVFDLYLNPTRTPKVREYKFPEFNSAYKLNIFSDGTTTLAPKRARREALSAPRNYVTALGSQTASLT